MNKSISYRKLQPKYYITLILLSVMFKFISLYYINIPIYIYQLLGWAIVCSFQIILFKKYFSMITFDSKVALSIILFGLIYSIYASVEHNENFFLSLVINIILFFINYNLFRLFLFREKNKFDNELNSLLDNLNEGITLLSDGKIHYINKIGVRLLGYNDKNELMGLEFSNLVSKVRVQNEEQHIYLNSIGEELTLSKYVINSLSITIVVISNKSLERLNTLNVTSLSQLDVLTGLPNRSQFNVLLEKSINQDHKTFNNTALIIINIDRFKWINDVYGQKAGDEILKSVAKRLEIFVGNNGFVARTNGDEFAVLLENIRAKEEAKYFINNLVNVLNQKYLIGDLAIEITTSIGIAMYPKNAKDSETLLRHAEVALEFTKTQDRNGYTFFKEEMIDSLKNHIDIANDLKIALKKHQFFIKYQPQVNSTTNEIIGLEALIRWNHPQKGTISPGVFIPIAEETGLIIGIGEWVISECCRQLKEWLDMGFPPVRIGVNISVKHFNNKYFEKYLMREIERFAIPSTLIDIEITESVFLVNDKESLNKISAISNFGFPISLDDFGTGYSSLSYLSKIPITQLKIAREFIQDIESYPTNKAIISSIMALSKVLNLDVIAEGVERKEELDFLRSLNCVNIQGYIYYQPLDVLEVQKVWNEKRNSFLTS